jgi:hypothetical protein
MKDIVGQAFSVCIIVGGLSVAACAMNGTPPMLVGGIILLTLGIIGSVVVNRMD